MTAYSAARRSRSARQSGVEKKSRLSGFASAPRFVTGLPVSARSTAISTWERAPGQWVGGVRECMRGYVCVDERLLGGAYVSVGGYVCVYSHVWMHACTCMHVYAYVYRCAMICVWRYLCMSVCMHARLHARTRTYTHARIHKHDERTFLPFVV